MPSISFRPLAEEDLPVIAGWFAEPAIARWWGQLGDLSTVTAKYLPRIEGREPVSMWIVDVDREPSGLLQYYRHADDPEQDARVGIPDAVGIDYLLSARQRGRGLSGEVLRRFAALALDSDSTLAACVATPAQANEPSWRALERAGFSRRGVCQPSEEPPQYVYVLGREERPDGADPAERRERAGATEPPASLWTTLGLVPDIEVHGGFQSKVYRAQGRTGAVIVKLVETGDDDALLRRRVEVTRRMAAIDPAVVGPLTIGPEPVVSVDGWSAVCYPYVDGTRLDTGDRQTVEAMAATLAALHASLATVTDAGLPPVTALAEAGVPTLGRGQLIHGDFAAANLIATSSGLKVIDFDECGEGSVEFELGNSLYMVRFDAWHAGQRHRYNQFRTWFVDAYRRAASFEVDDAVLDEAISIRARALERWLARPADAPAGIRNSSPEWRRRLRSFLAEARDAGTGL